MQKRGQFYLHEAFVFLLFAFLPFRSHFLFRIISLFRSFRHFKRHDLFSNFEETMKIHSYCFAIELDNERKSLISNEELVPLCWCLPSAPSVVLLKQENVENMR